MMMHPTHDHPPRRNRGPASARASLALLLLALGVPSLLGGCLFLEPDRDTAGLRVEMIARAHPEEGLARAVVDPADVLASDELSAQARLFRTAPDAEGVELVRIVPLELGPFDPTDSSRRVSGTLDFDLGPVGSTYRLEAVILYLGTDLVGTPDELDPVGTWSGDISFDAGDLNVAIRELVLAATADPDRYDGTIRLFHPSLSSDLPAVPFSDLVYDPSDGSMEMQYTAPELVEWDETNDSLEVIRVRFRAAYVPEVAFEGDVPVDPQGPETTIELELAPLTPFEPGRRIAGELQVGVFENAGTNTAPVAGALLLEETGEVSLRR